MSLQRLDLGELVADADQILLLEFRVDNNRVAAKVVEVLEGESPADLSLEVEFLPPEEAGKSGYHARLAPSEHIFFKTPAGVERRVAFFHPRIPGLPLEFYQQSLQPDFLRDRVVELISMKHDAAPFIRSPRFTEDRELSIILGKKFAAFSFTSPDVPDLIRLWQPDYFFEPMPWVRARVLAYFSFQKPQEKMLHLTRLDGRGPLADFIRKRYLDYGFANPGDEAEKELPAAFRVLVDTLGPERAVGISRDEALGFLRRQLHSAEPKVVKAAFSSLKTMLDADSVPIANEMLLLPDRKLSIQASTFLCAAKDPRSVDALCDALDNLMPRLYAAPHGSDGEIQFSESLGEAMCILRDPRAVPALTRAVFKGYDSGEIVNALCHLADEKGFEPFLSHLRVPDSEYHFGILKEMVKRSNLPYAPWMLNSTPPVGRVEMQRRARLWLDWWEANKERFQIKLYEWR